MTDNQIIVSGGWQASIRDLTPKLRFIMRDGKRILQQNHRILRDGWIEYEWRDVPLSEEE